MNFATFSTLSILLCCLCWMAGERYIHANAPKFLVGSPRSPAGKFNMQNGTLITCCILRRVAASPPGMACRHVVRLTHLLTPFWFPGIAKHYISPWQPCTLGCRQLGFGSSWWGSSDPRHTCAWKGQVWGWLISLSSASVDPDEKTNENNGKGFLEISANCIMTWLCGS